MHATPRILVFTGDGKGKTTAAVGMAVRAAGHGLAVAIVQFIKSDRTSGELAALPRLGNVRVEQAGLGFLPPADDPAFARHRAAAEAGLQLAAELIAGRAFDLVVLDEVCLAVARGLLAESAVVDCCRAARPDSCVVLTGRGATSGLLELADTVTEMRCVKHGLSAGRAAQKGVER